MRAQRTGDSPDVGGTKVRRDLHRQRRVLAVAIGELRLFGLERSEQRIERSVGLQLAQALGVGRGNVDGDVARLGVYRAQAGEVIVDGAFVGRVEIPADVQSEDAAALGSEAGSRDVGEKAIEAVVVEAEAVDQRLRLREPEQPRARIAGLRPRRHRTAFDESEAERGETVDVRGVLVEACREADPVGKLDAHRLHRRSRHARRGKLRDSQRGGGVEARERELVRGLRIEREQQRTEQRIEHGRRARWQAGG